MWIFDKDALNVAMKEWVSKQKATGHPKAVENAEFVGLAIADFLETSPSLFKSLPASTEVTPERMPLRKNQHVPEVVRPPEKTSSTSNDDHEEFSVDSMLREWNSMR